VSEKGVFYSESGWQWLLPPTAYGDRVCFSVSGVARSRGTLRARGTAPGGAKPHGGIITSENLNLFSFAYAGLGDHPYRPSAFNSTYESLKTVVGSAAAARLSRSKSLYRSKQNRSGAS